MFQSKDLCLPALRTNNARSDPDRIVLGPPRRSFASSNVRTSGKGPDGLEETSNTKDRTSFHEKSRNGDASESKYFERKTTQANGRYGNRQDSEDPETEGRREYDRKPRWAGRDRNDQELEDDQTFDDSSRGGFSRGNHSRAKLSQSWFKKDVGDIEEENRRDADRAPDWRRDRARDREWDRSAKVEADPEWMDSVEPEEPFQVHTQEDFQRWKEKMKAGGATPLEKVESAIAISPQEAAPEKLATKSAVLEPDDSMDKFFAKFEAKGTEQKSGSGKAHGKTRFASLFSPATEVSKQVESPPPMPAAERPSSAQTPGSATDADQAGFARILEMLQTRSNNPTPQTQDATKPRTPLYARGTEPKIEHEARPPSQTLLPMFSGNKAPQQPEPEANQQLTQERYSESKSPIEQSAHTRQQSSINKDEVLLNLLRQASLAPKPQPPPPHPQSEMRTGGGMFSGLTDPNPRTSTMRGQMVSPVQGQDPAMIQRRDTGRSMFDESPMSMYPSEQGPGPREPPARRATNGPGFGDDPLIALLRGQMGPQRPMQPPQPPQGLPPGLQRPPGLDQMPRPAPSWPPQQPQPPSQPQRQPSLPPGLSNVPRGMAGAPFGQPQQIPPQQNLQQQQQQPRPQPPQQQRKYTGESGPAPGMPNLPPGMYPPPGFMNAGPPPGFPGAMGNHPGRYPGDPGSQQSRAFMEMYSDAGGRGVGLRGGSGNGGMPPYR